MCGTWSETRKTGFLTSQLNWFQYCNLMTYRSVYYYVLVFISETIEKFCFFLFSFTSLSSFFTHIETNQSVGGAKTGIPGEKTT